MSHDDYFHYTTTERRNALRITSLEPSLTFTQEGTDKKLECLDISLDGVAFHPSHLNDCERCTARFSLIVSGHSVGSVSARHVYTEAIRSGWQFVAMEDSVRAFLEEWVLARQKTLLREAAMLRMTQQEHAILGPDNED